MNQAVHRRMLLGLSLLRRLLHRLLGLLILRLRRLLILLLLRLLVLLETASAVAEVGQPALQAQTGRTARRPLCSLCCSMRSSSCGDSVNIGSLGPSSTKSAIGEKLKALRVSTGLAAGACGAGSCWP